MSTKINKVYIHYRASLKNILNLTQLFMTNAYNRDVAFSLPRKTFSHCDKSVESSLALGMKGGQWDKHKTIIPSTYCRCYLKGYTKCPFKCIINWATALSNSVNQINSNVSINPHSAYAHWLRAHAWLRISRSRFIHQCRQIRPAHNILEWGVH